MRILHVIAGAAVGGAETFAQDAILSLHGRGVTQAVLTRPWEGALQRYAAAGVAAHGMGFSQVDRALRRGRRIAAMASEMGADLVHAWMSRANAFIPPGMPCPVLGWFGDYYDLKYFRRTDSFVGVTPDIASYLRREGLPPERTFMVNTFGTMPEAPKVERASLDTPEDALVLLVLARMHKVKGIDTMLRALGEVPGAVLWLAGEGPAKAEYEALARELGLSARVRFLGWRTDRKALLEACDICVLPSRYEPFGTVIVEAWAMRRPLVATVADGARQYVTDGTNGLLCPIDDPPALAACLRRLADDPGLRGRLAQAGMAAYEADFTREIVTDRLIACYEACIRLGRRA
jgi:glycosyltransferase involved in cell wall biosynthesis